ncbi:LysR family transcriptional regulator [Craterilacuibacter sp.]|uniref:LysR family transcriptional regulator n=1 Tax=Craterilacuibacter sp. TaxID=2870909 RepID=UPI003F3C3A45
MDIRQLRAFVAVFEERNITQAAECLHVTQPTLSATLRQLETELATALFTRLPRGVEATDAARRLFPQAKKLIADADALAHSFRQRDSCLELTLGIEGDLGEQQIKHVLHAALATAGVLLTLEDGCSGDARIACETLRCEDELFLPLWEEDFVLALPAGHTLTGQTIAAHVLAREEWVMCAAHDSQQRLLAILGAHAPVHPHKAGSLTLAARMVAAGCGIAWLPASLAANLASATLAAPPYRRRIGLCYAPDALAKPALGALLMELGRPA